jgi:FAD/FMN-containing dehydrogenase
VGASQIIADPALLAHYVNDGSFVMPVVPLDAVRPADAEEVQAVVRFASRERIILFSLSSGTTYWGVHIPIERGIIIDPRSFFSGWVKHGKYC